MRAHQWAPASAARDTSPCSHSSRGGRCRPFNSFICRNDCCYQSRAHRPAEEVKVSPQEDKPQKTILCMICAFSLAFSFFFLPPFIIIIIIYFFLCKKQRGEKVKERGGEPERKERQREKKGRGASGEVRRGVRREAERELAVAAPSAHIPLCYKSGRKFFWGAEMLHAFSWAALTQGPLGRD